MLHRGYRYALRKFNFAMPGDETCAELFPHETALFVRSADIAYRLYHVAVLWNTARRTGWLTPSRQILRGRVIRPPSDSSDESYVAGSEDADNASFEDASSDLIIAMRLQTLLLPFFHNSHSACKKGKGIEDVLNLICAISMEALNAENRKCSSSQPCRS